MANRIKLAIRTCFFTLVSLNRISLRALPRNCPPGHHGPSTHKLSLTSDALRRNIRSFFEMLNRGRQNGLFPVLEMEHRRGPDSCHQVPSGSDILIEKKSKLAKLNALQRKSDSC